MKIEFPLSIVPEDQIPKKDQIIDVPRDDLANLHNVCLQLSELCQKENGLGISAVQTGIPWKLFVVKGDGSCPIIPKDEFGYFIDCSYKENTAEKVTSLEGCLSLRSNGRLRSFQLERSKYIDIIGYKFKIDDLVFLPINIVLSYQQQCVVFQHEIDHHNGILISDIGRELYIW